uniref:Uncharacterized protein n=1 Tax=Anguilla anguilla TaxID=7936 RepID=A0A0E9PUL6_ANGAN
MFVSEATTDLQQLCYPPSICCTPNKRLTQSLLEPGWETSWENRVVLLSQQMYSRLLL